MTFRPLAAAALLSLTACAWSGPGVPMKLDQATGPAPSQEERHAGMGELVYGAKGAERSVQFGAWEVDGDDIEVENQGDGTWVGLINAAYAGGGGRRATRHVRLHVEPGRIVGEGVSLSILEDAGAGTVTIRGYIGNETIFVTVAPDEIRTRTERLERSGENAWSREGPGTPVTLAVKGPAAELQRSAPFYLALVDAFR